MKKSVFSFLICVQICFLLTACSGNQPDTVSVSEISDYSVYSERATSYSTSATENNAGKESSVVNDTVLETSEYDHHRTEEVPKVNNIMEDRAVEMLNDKGFVAKITYEYSNTVDAGYVIDCNPKEGDKVVWGSKVVLIVSAGSKPEQIEVPDVIGMSFDRTKTILESLGFKIEKEFVTSDVEAGTVIGINPPVGSKIIDKSIKILVSDGSLIKRNLEYDVDLPENEWSPVTLTIILNESEGNNTVLSNIDSFIPAEGSKITILLDSDGAVDNKKYITVMLDEKIYETLIFDFKENIVMRPFLDTNYKPKSSQ